MTLPLAHLGHWLWTLYLVPVVVVVAGIVRSSISERRRQRRGDGQDRPGG